ncbi:MAG: hypothetical protein Q4D38_00265 [Planctomycetia bacterium]|nr:hypothetical protein [Planctomycetia bacterium]
MNTTKLNNLIKRAADSNFTPGVHIRQTPASKKPQYAAYNKALADFKTDVEKRFPHIGLRVTTHENIPRSGWNPSHRLPRTWGDFIRERVTKNPSWLTPRIYEWPNKRIEPKNINYRIDGIQPPYSAIVPINAQSQRSKYMLPMYNLGSDIGVAWRRPKSPQVSTDKLDSRMQGVVRNALYHELTHAMDNGYYRTPVNTNPITEAFSHEELPAVIAEATHRNNGIFDPNYFFISTGQNTDNYEPLHVRHAINKPDSYTQKDINPYLRYIMSTTNDAYVTADTDTNSVAPLKTLDNRLGSNTQVFYEDGQDTIQNKTSDPREAARNLLKNRKSKILMRAVPFDKMLTETGTWEYTPRIMLNGTVPSWLHQPTPTTQLPWPFRNMVNAVGNLQPIQAVEDALNPATSKQFYTADKHFQDLMKPATERYWDQSTPDNSTVAPLPMGTSEFFRKHVISPTMHKHDSLWSQRSLNQLNNMIKEYYGLMNRDKAIRNATDTAPHRMRRQQQRSVTVQPLSGYNMYES